MLANLTALSKYSMLLGTSRKNSNERSKDLIFQTILKKT
jgi:hypothetical protein